MREKSTFYINKLRINKISYHLKGYKLRIYKNKAIHFCDKRLFTKKSINNNKKTIMCFRVTDVNHIVSSYFSVGFTNKKSHLVTQDCFIMRIRKLKRLHRNPDFFRRFLPHKGWISRGCVIYFVDIYIYSLKTMCFSHKFTALLS